MSTKAIEALEHIIRGSTEEFTVTKAKEALTLLRSSPPAHSTILEAVKNAAVTCFNLGPEDESDMLSFLCRIEDVLGDEIPPAPSELVEAGDAMKQHLNGYLSLEANESAYSSVEAWDRAKSSQPSPWISVETRLPEDNKAIVLCHGTGGRFFTALFTENVFVTHDDYEADGVTLWMTLPPTPEQR